MDKRRRVVFRNVLFTDYTNELLEWRNQDFLRKVSADERIISKEEHNRFINELRSSDDLIVYVAFLDEKPVGVINIRYDDVNMTAKSGYYLINETDCRGGIGVLLAYVRRELIFKRGDYTIIGSVLRSNEMSFSLSRRANCSIEKKERVIRGDGVVDEIIYLSLDKKAYSRVRVDLKRIIDRFFLWSVDES